MRYKREVASWQRGWRTTAAGRGERRWHRKVEERREWGGLRGLSLTNIEVSRRERETSARPRPPFVAAQGKKVPSLNLSKCLYFSLASAAAAAAAAAAAPPLT